MLFRSSVFFFFTSSTGPESTSIASFLFFFFSLPQVVEEMQQVFPDEAAGLSRKPLISFPLLDGAPSLSNAVAASETLKRSRSPASPAQQQAVPTSEKRPLTQEELRALAGFIEYGNQSTPAADAFRESACHRVTPAQLFPSGAGMTRLSIPPSYQWCGVALRQALSLLCRVIQLDTASYYLQPASTTTATAQTASEAAATVARPVTTLELYCRYQALELELEDTMLRAQATTHADGAPEAVKQQAKADMAAVVRCVADAVNALETTLVEMLFSLEAPPALQARSPRGRADDENSYSNKANSTGKSSANAFVSVPSLEYVAAIVRGLPDVFQSEQWPTRFICDVEGARPAANEPAPSLFAASSSYWGAGSAFPGLTAALSGGHVASTASSGSSKDASTQLVPPTGGVPTATSAAVASASAASVASYRAQVGGATTSLALQSLLRIRSADVWNVLGVATASPISRLAALEKLKSASQGSPTSISVHTALPERAALDIEQLEFKDVLVRAWNHGYGLLGLRRLRFEMRALFFQYSAKAAAGKNGSCATAATGATRQEIYQLWYQWERSLQSLFAAFMRKAAGDTEVSNEGGGDVLRELLSDSAHDACAVMRRHTLADAGLAEVQHIALRVVEKLQVADTQGWFAVPAFDLVNVDFTSMRHWIASPSFAHKSRREAYRSLCRVLERMVDSCVQKYGPTHAFSDVITNVRQQLVDVARAEGLL